MVQQQQQQRVCLLSKISIHFRLLPRFVERGRRDVEAHAAFARVRRSRVIIRVVGFYLLYFCGFARILRVSSSIIRLGLSFVRRVRLVR